MTTKKESALLCFKKASSTINTVMKMLEENRYCIDVMQQNLAAIGLLKSAHQLLMENHLSTCFKTAMSSKNEKKKKEMIKEILSVSKISNK
ncbi:MAG: metal-sensing transcriptional repressor [Patescibacteria group bacterium]|jgi:DNA-binding FrmR family transcriptional regulator